MTRFEEFLLRRIFRKAMRQSGIHSNNIERLYALIRETAREAFSEDSGPGLDAYLMERFWEVHPFSQSASLHLIVAQEQEKKE